LDFRNDLVQLKTAKLRRFLFLFDFSILNSTADSRKKSAAVFKTAAL
jgi:hypothetical protein